MIRDDAESGTLSSITARLRPDANNRAYREEIDEWIELNARQAAETCGRRGARLPTNGKTPVAGNADLRNIPRAVVELNVAHASGDVR
jgi:hypothetical protein